MSEDRTHGSQPIGNWFPMAARQSRFHSPLVEPDVRISRIRLSDGIPRTGTRVSACKLFASLVVSLVAAESSLEVLGNMATLLILDCRRNAPEVRPLPSAGVTRLPRYYEPLRLPARPSLPLTSCWLVLRPPSRVSRVALESPCHVPSSLPRWNPRTLDRSVTPGQRPSPFGRRVGFHDLRFRGLLDVHDRREYASSVFVMARWLAELPRAAL